jgi:hypothetical protein
LASLLAGPPLGSANGDKRKVFPIRRQLEHEEPGFFRRRNFEADVFAAPTPFLGYFFLLEDCPKVKTPIRNKEPYFKVDPAFEKASYSKRYELLCRRLVLERVYSAACLVMATNAAKTEITQPAEDLSFKRFAAAMRGHVVTFLESRK